MPSFGWCDSKPRAEHLLAWARQGFSFVPGSLRQRLRWPHSRLESIKTSVQCTFAAVAFESCDMCTHSFLSKTSLTWLDRGAQIVTNTLHEYDTDKDGKLNFEEFKALLSEQDMCSTMLP